MLPLDSFTEINRETHFSVVNREGDIFFTKNNYNGEKNSRGGGDCKSHELSVAGPDEIPFPGPVDLT